MSKSGPVWVKNLQSVVAGVSDPLHPDLPLEVPDVPAGDHRDLAVGELGQHLQNFLGLGRDYGQGRFLSEERNCPIKVEDDTKLGAVIHQATKVLLEIFNIQLVNILLRVMTFILLINKDDN